MPGTNMKTIVYKQAGPTSLYADVYLPDVEDGLPKHPGEMLHQSPTGFPRLTLSITQLS